MDYERMNARFRKQWDSLRSTYWFVPVVMTACVVVLWVGTSVLDGLLAAAGHVPIAWLYTDDRDAVRTLLLAVAGAVIGIVGVVFSITMVPLTIAASQFGPRLLRTFLRDTGTQATLGTFIATFIFCMLVLLSLHGEPTQPLPQLSVTVALLLALASLCVLLYFINHVAVSIQAPMVAVEVSNELHDAIDRELPHPLDAAGYASSFDDSSIGSTCMSRPLMARASGYAQTCDDDSLMRLAIEHNLVIRLLHQPGDFVTQGTPLAIIWSDGAITETVDEAINTAFLLSYQRTLVQDVTFGINELVEMAARALSPAINDPFTAMTCLDWIGTALCRVCGRTFPAAVRRDDTGHVRLLMDPLTFTQLADAAFSMIREYGRTSTAVTLRLLDTILTVAHCIQTDEQRAALLHHATLIERGSASGLIEADDRQRITHRYAMVQSALGMQAAGAESQTLYSLARDEHTTD